MPYVRPIELTEDEFNQLNELVKHASHWRERQRAQTILWLSQGKTVKEISDLHSVIPETIRLHRRKWKANKMDAIWEGKRSGHPPKLLEHHKEKILSWVNNEPLNTAQIKLKLYEEFQLEVSQEPIRVFLKSKDIVYKRTRHSLKKKMS